MLNEKDIHALALKQFKEIQQLRAELAKLSPKS